MKQQARSEHAELERDLSVQRDCRQTAELKRKHAQAALEGSASSAPDSSRTSPMPVSACKPLRKRATPRSLASSRATRGTPQLR